MTAENESIDMAGRVPAQPVPSEPLSTGASLGVCAAGWLVPGLGHVLLGRWGRGLVFGAAIVTMFVLGLGMKGRIYGVVPEEPLHVFAFIAHAGTGLGYVIARFAGLGNGVLSNPDYDYGSTYLWVAGLLNYLVLLDAFDIAQGRKP
jgi:Family of unknown function (DUF6677)